MRTETMDSTSAVRATAHTKEHEAHGHYARFAAMIATSSVIMYFVMYLNTYTLEHAHWSMTRLYMTLLMASTMSIVMLSYMRSMMKNKGLNRFIYWLSTIVFVGALVLVRNQIFIGDQAWMNAMIPHHSIAVLTSERANIEDVRAKDLSRRIIDTQLKEIAEMKWLINDIEQNGPARTDQVAGTRPVPQF